MSLGRSQQPDLAFLRWRAGSHCGEAAKLTIQSGISPRTSTHLDLIRGLSALAVMSGHEAVMVFFVLSGFFIGTSVLESFRERRWSWRAYLINRLTRLQLVLVPASLARRVTVIPPSA